MNTPIIGYHNKRGVSLSELVGEEKVVTAPAPIEELHGLEASIPNEIIDRFITHVQWTPPEPYPTLQVPSPHPR